MTVQRARRLVATVLATVVLASCSGGEDDPRAWDLALAAILASCAETTGEVQVKRAGAGFWQDAAVGEVFHPGDWVRTGRGSFTRIEFVGGGSLSLDASSIVIVDAAEVAPPPARPARPEARVTVESGTVQGLLARKGQPGADRPLRVRNADGREARIASERGEPVELRLSRRKAGTEIAVRRGSAKVQVDEEVRVLAAGKAVELSKERVADVELLAPPAPSDPGPDARLRFRDDAPLQLRWAKVPGAASYRLQLARDSVFRDVLATEDVETAEARVAAPGLGTYFWRVSAVDGEGRASDASEPRRLILEREEPEDLLAEPRDGATYAHGDAPPVIRFAWREVQRAERYRLVVASSADLLRQPVVSEVTAEVSAEVGELGPGTWYWGVFVHDDRQEPLFLLPRRVVVRRGGGSVRIPDAIRKWGD